MTATFRRYSLWIPAVLLTVLFAGEPEQAQSTLFENVNRADSLRDAGRIDSALALISAVLPGERITPIVRDTSAIPALFRLATHFEARGALSEAKRLYRVSVAVLAAACNDDALILADTVYSLGRSYRHQGHYLRAEVFCANALNTWTKANDPRAIDAHILLGITAAKTGRGDETLMHYSRAAKLSEDYYGIDHLNTARAQSGLANVYFTEAKYAKAEPLYKWVLGICLDSLGESSRCVTMTLTNLGLIYRALGEYSLSEDHFQRALRIFGDSEEPNPFGLTAALEGLAATYRVQGRFEEAISLYLRALRILRELGERGIPTIRDMLPGLGEVAYKINRFAEAEEYQREALRLADSTLGRDNTVTGQHIEYLGEIYAAKGDLRGADSLYNEALAIHRSTTGEASTWVADCLEAISAVHRQSGRLKESAELASQAVDIRHRLLREFSLVVSERDALLSSHNLQYSIDNLLTNCSEGGAVHSLPDDRIINILLSSKGEISDAIFERRHMLSQPKDSATSEMWEALRGARFRLSQLYVDGPDSDDDKDYQSAVDSLNMIIAQRDGRLSEHLDSYRESKMYNGVDHARVASLLPDNSVLVEYQRYKHFTSATNDDWQPRYIAATIGSDSTLSITPLGGAEPIDDLITKYREHFARIAAAGHLPTEDDKSEYKQIAVALFESLVAPIESSLGDKDLVFVAPDSRLNWISFATLIDDDNHYLLERYPIHYLSSGRDLLRLQNDAKPTAGLLAVGDPAFATPKTPKTALQQSHESLPSPGKTTNGTRSLQLRSNCTQLQDLKLSPLPNTRVEIGRVLDIWANETAEPADTLLGISATEDQFKQRAHGKRVIHLSTHGYYLQGSCTENESNQNRHDEELVVTEDPLLQSGLFLAGCMDASPTTEAPSPDTPAPTLSSPQGEDGVLTAAEIAGMDLSGTQLVVLSACETGLGRLYQGEGVYGLRRAFQIAGARTVISTLWPIADELTAPMLPPIYRLSHALLPNRLRTTQLDWINTLRQNGLSDHPYSWGAFIAQGDWR